jgi:hypothetical protein
VTPACPAPNQRDAFVDDGGSTHEAAIDCAFAHGLVRGTSETTFSPRRMLTRAQAASLLVRFIEAAEGGPLVALPFQFRDVSGNVHAENIAKASTAGVVLGYPDGTFGPKQLVSRAQFASLAVRAMERLQHEPLGRDALDAFDDDDGNAHEVNIEKAHDNGIVSGFGERRFGPNASVSRGQAASVVVKAYTEAL